MPIANPQLTDEVLLQVEETQGVFRCRKFNGVPAARRAWIVLLSSGSDQSSDYVRSLAAEFEIVLQASSPGVTSEELECPVSPADMNPADYPDRRKLLVLVGSSDSPFQNTPWYEHWKSDQYDATVMTVLPPGNFEDMFAQDILQDDDHLLIRVNAAHWKNKIAEALPAILARADITSAASRVFISYRRLETLPLALQLFDELTHEGFDVFLDRFSIPPGYDFQRRLNQELEDKSMVVLLESKGLKESRWTQHEIDFAKRNRLGLISITMPSISEKDLLTSVNLREKPVQTEFVGEPAPVEDPKNPGVFLDQWPKLREEALNRVVSVIKQAHTDSLFRRRHRLRADLVSELKKRGVQAEYCAVGPLLVGPDQHMLWLTTRPPQVDDFRELHAAHTVRTNCTVDSLGIIVGPLAAHEPDRHERVAWLCRVSNCLSFDEGNLADFARRVAETDWND